MSAMTLSMRFPSHGHSNNSVAHTIAYTDRPYREAQAVPNYRFDGYYDAHGDPVEEPTLCLPGEMCIDGAFCG